MIEVLVGMIASGKSTHSQRRAAEGAIILNDDAIVTGIHGGNYGLYDPELKPLYKTMAMNAACVAVSLGRDVIVDATNLTIKTRARWIGLAAMFDQPVICTEFALETPEIHARRRVDHDGRGFDYEHWLKVAHSHIARYEIPSTSEGFNSVLKYSERY